MLLTSVWECNFLGKWCPQYPKTLSPAISDDFTKTIHVHVILFCNIFIHEGVQRLVYSVFKPIRRVELYLYQSTFPYYLIFQACLLYNMRCVVPLLSPLTLVSHCQISRDQSNPLLETQYCHRLLSSQKLYEISPQRL